MKKIICLLLIFVMCVTFTGSAFAADFKVIEEPTTAVIAENEEVTDENANEELEHLIEAACKAATLVYNYATQPEEPAVDLDTVLMIVAAIVSVAYAIYQQQNA